MKSFRTFRYSEDLFLEMMATEKIAKEFGNFRDFHLKAKAVNMKERCLKLKTTFQSYFCNVLYFDNAGTFDEMAARIISRLCNLNV